MAATPYGPPPGFEPHWGHIDEAPHKGPAAETPRPVVPPQLSAKPGLLDRDPGGVVFVINSIVLATIAVLQGFEIVHWTDQQQGLVMALVLAVIGGVQLIIGRGRAYAPKTVDRLLEQQRRGI